jgi:hypothetical protein
MGNIEQSYYNIPHFYLPLFSMIVIKDWKTVMLMFYFWESLETIIYKKNILNLGGIVKEEKWNSLVIDPFTDFLGTMLGYLIIKKEKNVNFLKNTKSKILFLSLGISTATFFKNKKYLIILMILHSSFLTISYLKYQSEILLLLLKIYVSLTASNLIFTPKIKSDLITTYTVGGLWIVIFFLNKKIDL